MCKRRLGGGSLVPEPSLECVGAEEEEDEAWRRRSDPQLRLVVEDDVAEAGGARGLDEEARGGQELRGR